MPTLLISGANRGIGLEFVRQYVGEGWSVHALVRRPEEAGSLRELSLGIAVHRYEATDEDSLHAARLEIGSDPIDALIANAGVSAPRETLAESVQADEFRRVMMINAYAPLALAAAFLPNLLAGEKKGAFAVTSLLGSITLNSGSSFIYRASKAALNQVWRTLSIEWRQHEIPCLLLRPGKVRTRMTGFSGDLSVGESVAGLRRVISQCDLSQTGAAVGFDGKVVPW